MDIFQAFLSHNDENPPTFSEIFHSAAALRRALGTKSYLLDHYLSLFFRLTAQIDFVALQDEVHQVMADTQHSFKENPSLLSEFPCQEPATKINLCFLEQADSILEQTLKDFLREKTFSHTGFGNGSRGLSAVSENFWARKKRLIYQSLFHFFSQKNLKSHHITTHRILESEIIA